MRCQNIASLWSASPPSHRVTSALSLPNPPSLYTGASDGSIVWWKLPGNPIPFALLCGHASAISALSACSPLADALLSACSDGVLCVWSRESGHCRRRRKLPPWTGSPAGASALPSSPRYVCVTCVAPAGDGEGDEHPRKCPRLAVLVIDSCGLNVVQTIAHEPMPLGPLKCARVISEFGEAEGDAVVLADAWGNTEVVGIQKENEGDVDTGKGVRRSISVGVAGESSERGGEAVCVDVNGTLLAVVFEARCTFKTVVNGLVVGEICLKDTPFCSKDRAAEAQLAGCVFLQSEGMPGGAAMRFALWSTSGAAAVYEMKSISDNEFLFELICEIPVSLQKLSSPSSVIFCELQSSLLRVQSCRSFAGNSSTWRPFVTIWSVPDPLVSYPDPGGIEVGLAVSRMIGDGGFSAGWSNHNISSVEHLDGRQYLGNAEEGSGSSAESHATNFKDRSTKAEKCDRQLMMHGHVVTSSMVLSENSFAPYAVVYGFDNGDIEVTRFWNSFADLGCTSESATKHTGSSVTKQSFLGHRDGVVCLAAHHMVSKSNENHLSMALVSGSLDCTVRVWDMDNGNLVSVLHHHVAPVRQIVLAPPSTFRPWSDCFLSVGEDGCVALTSLETLKVERMFPGHPSYPSKVVWDSARGYIACLCKNVTTHPDSATTLCIWDVKTGARERVLRGAATHAMFDHFCGGIKVNELTGNVLGGTTSASLLHLPVIEDTSLSSNMSTMKGKDKYAASGDDQNRSHIAAIGSHPSHRLTLQHHYKTKIPAVKCSCPFPGIAILKFDLASILSIRQTCEFSRSGTDKQVNTGKLNHEAGKLDYHLPPQTSHDACDKQDANIPPAKESLEGDLIRFSLAFLHLWDVDQTLDALLRDEMNIVRPEGLCVASGVPGDKGSLMLTFPGLDSTLELWKTSAEFSAMRSLTIVSLAQRLLTLSHASSTASSALAAFYTRNFAEKVPSIKPPLLQILVSFWQDPSEHVRMAARSLFHCAAPRAVPSPIYSDKIIRPGSPSIPVHIGDDYAHYGTSGDSSSNDGDSNTSTESGIVAWLESYDMHDWISCIGGTPQDAMASHIVVAAALSVWYPSIVKLKLAEIVSNHLIKLVMVAHERYSSTAAELLSEGMDNTWKPFIGSDIPRLIGDIFFQIECLSGSSASYSKQHPALAIKFQEALTGILLPSLAMADVPGFLHVIESQIWATSSDSPVHLVSLKALIRVIRGSPKLLTPYLDKVVNFILQTMDPANPAMRKVCLQSSTAALKEVARGFPMVAVNEPFSRLAVGDAVGDINNVTIRIYDLRSLSKIKVLDASGPPGLSILSGTTDATITTAISVLSFSPDGEGLVAFSEQGLVIRWWSLGSAWWEKLGRNMVPTQCTKLIFVPPWEGFSPNSSRSSIMASIISLDNQIKLQEKKKESNDDSLKASLHNLDLSYRLEWVEGKKVALTRFGRELGLFQF